MSDAQMMDGIEQKHHGGQIEEQEEKLTFKDWFM